MIADAVAALLSDTLAGRLDFESPAGRIYSISRPNALPVYESSWLLEIKHGRKGRLPRERTEGFKTPEAMAERARFLVRVRLRHGYRLI